jgi:hypothetical protein
MNRIRPCLILGVLGLAVLPRPADPACCYFSAKEQDVNQPAQKAFITWDAQEEMMSWTVQPKFEGNAADFGMVIPVPTRPKLAEMPRDFFKELAVFTILKPMDLEKYKKFYGSRFGSIRGGVVLAEKEDSGERKSVRVLESGVVGSLDYKIIAAEQAEDLFSWLKDNKYQFAGDAKTLDHYVQKKWFFTVMKIDPKQMKKAPDGSYLGEVTPTQFRFSSKVPVYPVRITQISVKRSTEALFYILSKTKMDLPGDWSYQCQFQPMWDQALSYALPEKITKEETDWQAVVKPELDGLRRKAEELLGKGRTPTKMEYSKMLTEADLGVLDGTVKYDRGADTEAIENLKILKGHLRKGLFLTKCRKIFMKEEMTDDLVFVPAKLGGKEDWVVYDRILPTSPP